MPKKAIIDEATSPTGRTNAENRAIGFAGGAAFGALGGPVTSLGGGLIGLAAGHYANKRRRKQLENEGRRKRKEEEEREKKRKSKDKQKSN